MYSVCRLTCGGDLGSSQRFRAVLALMCPRCAPPREDNFISQAEGRSVDSIAEGSYREAERRIADAAQARDRPLVLAGLGLTAVPDSIGQLTSLTNLDLQDNQLTTLPDSIGQLTSLTDLDLHDNQL